MVVKDLRQKSRREDERRARKRRLIPYSFGSEEWEDAIKEDYLLWPKQDRRLNERRHQPRRMNSRRTQARGRAAKSPVDTAALKEILSSEEKQMINELIQSDWSD